MTVTGSNDVEDEGNAQGKWSSIIHLPQTIEREAQTSASQAKAILHSTVVTHR